MTGFWWAASIPPCSPNTRHWPISRMGQTRRRPGVRELAAVIEAAVPESEVRQYLVDVFGFGRNDEWAIPADIIWPALDLCDPDALEQARSVGA